MAFLYSESVENGNRGVVVYLILFELRFRISKLANCFLLECISRHAPDVANDPSGDLEVLAH